MAEKAEKAPQSAEEREKQRLAEIEKVVQETRGKFDILKYLQNITKGVSDSLKNLLPTVTGFINQLFGKAAPAAVAPSSNVDMSKASTIMDVFKQMDRTVIQQKLGEVPLIVLFGQMRLESGANLSALAKTHNNFFGIKYVPGMKNATATSQSTKEQTTSGKEYTIKADFAHFNTPEDCFAYYASNMMNPEGRQSYYGWFQDFSKKLENTYAVKEGAQWNIKNNASSAPAGGIKLRGNPVIAIAAIKESGYATDTQYVQKIYSIMSANKEIFGVSQNELDAGLAYVKALPKQDKPLMAQAKKLGATVA